MQEKHLFEYAIIRVMPRVERGEFMNVGVVLYCSAQKFLQTRFEINEPRLFAFCAGVDLSGLKERLAAFDQICSGGVDGGTIGKLPMASRFRWLTATRSTVLQTSPVHPGLCANADEMLAGLYARLVQ